MNQAIIFFLGAFLVGTGFGIILFSLSPVFK